MAAVSSPLQFSPLQTRRLMLLVLLAATPAVALSTWFFGYGVILNIGFAMLVGIATEAGCLKLRGKPLRPGLTDNSTLVTALLFGVAIPPGSPWWLILPGMIFAIALVKHAYGGLGQNLFNPAMAGYLLLLLAYPSEMNTWHLPLAAISADSGSSPLGWAGFMESLECLFPLAADSAVRIDGLAMATPLTEYGMAGHSTVMAAFHDGLPLLARTSETGWELVNFGYLLGGLLLLALGVIRWHIPVSIIASVLLMSLLFDSAGGAALSGTLYLQIPYLQTLNLQIPYLHLFGSATMIGAFFIATDPVSAATSNPARILYGIIIGCSIYGIRVWGSYPDSIAIAVLFGNFCAPLLDYHVRPRIFGQGRAGKTMNTGSRQR